MKVLNYFALPLITAFWVFLITLSVYFFIQQFYFDGFFNQNFIYFAFEEMFINFVWLSILYLFIHPACVVRFNTRLYGSSFIMAILIYCLSYAMMILNNIVLYPQLANWLVNISSDIFLNLPLTLLPTLEIAKYCFLFFVLYQLRHFIVIESQQTPLSVEQIKTIHTITLGAGFIALLTQISPSDNNLVTDIASMLAINSSYLLFLLLAITSKLALYTVGIALHYLFLRSQFKDNLTAFSGRGITQILLQYILSIGLVLFFILFLFSANLIDLNYAYYLAALLFVFIIISVILLTIIHYALSRFLVRKYFAVQVKPSENQEQDADVSSA